MIRFSLMSRPDGKMAIFSPEMQTSLIIDKESFKTLFMEISKDHPEFMPSEVLPIGLSFGEMSRTTWDKVQRLAKKLGCEIVA